MFLIKKLKPLGSDCFKSFVISSKETIMKKITYLALLAIATVAMTFTACDIDNIVGENTRPIEIRVQNISGQEMESITVQENDFGSLTAGEKSAYQSLEYFSQCGGTITENITVNNGDIEYTNPYYGMIICGTGIDYGLEGGNKYTIKLDLNKVTEAGTGSNDLIIEIIED